MVNLCNRAEGTFIANAGEVFSVHLNRPVFHFYSMETISDTVSLRGFDTWIAGRKLGEDKTRTRRCSLGRVPCKNSRHMSRSLTEGPPGTLLPCLPTWMGRLYGTQLSTDLNPTSIYVYLLINTFICYFRRFKMVSFFVVCPKSLQL